MTDWELPSPDDADPPPVTLRWVEGKLGAAIVDVAPLPGGISSAVHRLTLDTAATAAAGRNRVVLRRHTNTDWMAREPYIPHDEARMLDTLRGLDVGVPTPTLIAADPDGKICDVPTIVMSEIDGRPEITPSDPTIWAEKLAACLAAIHQTPVPVGLSPFRRWDNPDNPDSPIPRWIDDESQWREGRRRAAGPLPAGRPTFLHRDFHPNNVHWEHGEICGVVDWLSACVGPVEADLSHCRWNLAILESPELAEHFTSHYRDLDGRRAATDNVLTAYDLATILSAPVGPFPTYAWNQLGREDLTADVVAGRIEIWLERVLSSPG